MDTYFLPPEQRGIAVSPVTGKEYRDDNHPSSFDLEKLRQDILLASKGTEYDVIIIEGLLTLWDKAIYGMLSLRLFVDCRADERIVRRLKRNMGWGLTFDEISAVYIDMVRYRHDEYVEPSKWKADFILNGSSPSPLALDMITAYIKNNV